MIDYTKFIDADPAIMLGKPKIKGTRLTVELILEKISAGFSFEEIIDMYPPLSREAILACIAYAADILKSEENIIAA
jgi:uncharacterized protein (DUF433 family)